MKVKCIKNSISSLEDKSLIELVKKSISIPDESSELDFQIGQEYFVYGITFRDNLPYFYLLDSDSDEYPTPKAAAFFKIVDDRLSRYWALFYSFTPYGPSTDILFREWGKNENFYWDLIEGEDYAIKKFAQMKLKMEIEFA